MAIILGLDPDINKIPDAYKSTDGSVDVVNWGKDVIHATSADIHGIKFQMAYFEAYGIYGLETLAALVDAGRSMGLKIVMDGKRGDIGSTSAAYAKAYLNPKNYVGDNPFFSDFLTINPLMGEDCLLPFIEAAVENNCGLFILLETSNPGAEMILKSKLETGSQINEKIADFIQDIHSNMDLNDGEIGPLGCVIGATNSNTGHWRKKLPNSLFLMPGIGAQGGNMDSVKTVMLPNGNGVWVPISRGITHAPESLISRLEYKTLVESNAKKYNYAFKSLI